MDQKRIAIITCDLEFEEAVSFSNNLSRLIYSGLGSSNILGRKLDMAKADGLRALLGVPESWLTPWRQQVLETVYAYTFDLALTAHPGIWTTEPDWKYTNPNATNANFEHSVLDLDYIESFGLRRAIWEKEILYTQLKNPRGAEQNFRLYMALALFGFPEPQQFFRNRHFCKPLNTG